MVSKAVRTQIYLTEAQRARLAERARRDGHPVSRIIRDAVDEFLEDEDDLDATFGVMPAIGSGIPERTEWVRRG